MRPGRDANEVVREETTFVADKELRDDAGTNDETSAGRESSAKRAHRDNIVGSDMFSFMRLSISSLRGFESVAVVAVVVGACYPGRRLNDSLTL